MREIKFRAWDKVNKKWIKHFNVDLLNVPQMQFVELMQYTGLKDKNGKEIYEGDIISFGDSKTVVFYEHAKFKVKHRYDNSCYRYYDLREASYFNKGKVIGNIYENKELLE